MWYCVVGPDWHETLEGLISTCNSIERQKLWETLVSNSMNSAKAAQQVVEGDGALNYFSNYIEKKEFTEVNGGAL